ncbi:phage tail tape measure protein, TP901 family, core region [Thiohalospira halophila DSM 15071]|uniref:Phage tail tape measure protein, TP901 family, core region n=1 Tax=Thiohalospira halophila DSM 15071 TaxID=1123397 RepID=A0A1I1UG18_9GAMM|nr:phage tail tape measure protein [Thiohalospira halophila]SFD68558.1 phage tail tape measure protein, TP901 family, core region [Thiohalospira halophila DSM 15071]
MADTSIGIRIGASLAPSLGNAMRSVEERTSRVGSALRQTWNARDVAGGVIRYRDQLQALRRKQAQTGDTSARMQQGIADLERRYSEAKAAAKSYGMSIAGIDREYQRLSDSAATAERQMQRLQTLQNNSQRRQQLHGEVMGTVGAAIAAAAPIRAAVQFESAMADVRKVVDFDTPEQFEAMGNEIRRLSTQMPMAAEGIADVVAAAGQSGIARDQLTAFAESAVRMGTAFDLSGAQAGKMMASWRAGMGLTQQQTNGLADAVNHLSNNLNAEAGELAKVVQREGATAQAAGLAATETASLGAALLSSGTSAERASTALKKITGSLTAGEAATARQKEGLAALGMEAGTLAKRMQTDAQGAIEDVFAKIRELDGERQGAITKQIFGEESKSAIMPLIGQLENLRQANQLTADETQYLGSTQAEYEERSKTTANALQLMGNRVTSLGITLGSVLLPPLNQALSVIGAGVTWITQMAEAYPGVTTAVVGLAVGLVGLKVAMLGARYAGTLFSDAITVGRMAVDLLRPSTWRLVAAKVAYVGASLRARFAALSFGGALKAVAVGAWATSKALIGGVVTAIKAVGLALLTNPIGLIITGLVVGATLIWRYWEPISGFFGRIWGGITNAISSGMGWIKNALAWSPLGLLMQYWDPITEWIGGLFGGIKKVVSGAMEWLDPFIQPLKDVAGWIGDAASAVGGWFGGDDEGGEAAKPDTGGDSSPTVRRGGRGGAPASTPAASTGGGGSGGGGVVVHQRVDRVEIQVSGAEGMSVEDLAEAVRAQFDSQSRQLAEDHA